jgi:hypothetical protein
VGSDAYDAVAAVDGGQASTLEVRRVYEEMDPSAVEAAVHASKARRWDQLAALYVALGNYLERSGDEFEARAARRRVQTLTLAAQGF